MNQDAKNNQAQLPRAPAQRAPACPPRRPFSWVPRANCFVSLQLLVRRLPGVTAGMALHARLPRPKRHWGAGPLPEPRHSPPLSLGAEPFRAGHPTPACLGPLLELPEFLLGNLNSRGRGAVPLILRATWCSPQVLTRWSSCVLLPSRCLFILSREQPREAQTLELAPFKSSCATLASL